MEMTAGEPQTQNAAPPTGPPQPGGRRFLATALALALLLGAGSGAAVWSLLNATSSKAPIQTVAQATQPIQSQAPSAATGGSLNLAALTAKASPWVADINTTFVTGSGSGKAAGTGIILTADGEILTNNHVVEGATSIQVTIAGRSGTFTAQVLGVNPTSDVALIRVQGVSGLPVATLADSSTLSVGQPVVALGNALGAGGAPSVTQGTITALNQSITAGGTGTPEQLAGMIESDAPIQPGDSGGPLVNSAGQVVGMTTAGQTTGRRTTTSTLGYAIPTNNLLPIVNQIRAGISSPTVIIGATGYIGVTVTDVTPAVASNYGLSVSSGVLIIAVTAGSPAESAGITQGSVITSIGGTSITTTQGLGTVLHSHKPGDVLRIGWIDQTGTAHTAAVTLTTGPVV